jgi:hypothetical protein
LQSLVIDAPSVKDGCRIAVNGQAVSTRYWPPYSADILPFVKEGENQVEFEVFNSLENLYGRNQKDSGLTEILLRKVYK